MIEELPFFCWENTEKGKEFPRSLGKHKSRLSVSINETLWQAEFQMINHLWYPRLWWTLALTSSLNFPSSSYMTDFTNTPLWVQTQSVSKVAVKPDVSWWHFRKLSSASGELWMSISTAELLSLLGDQPFPLGFALSNVSQPAPSLHPRCSSQALTLYFF